MPENETKRYHVMDGRSTYPHFSTDDPSRAMEYARARALRTPDVIIDVWDRVADANLIRFQAKMILTVVA